MYYLNYMSVFSDYNGFLDCEFILFYLYFY